MADSKEIECLSRLEIVIYLRDLGIRPAKGQNLNELYKEEYIKYICTRLLIHKNQVPDEVIRNLYEIKNLVSQTSLEEEYI